jgi:hypothetical protein
MVVENNNTVLLHRLSVTSCVLVCLSVQKSHNAKRPFVAPLQGAGCVGGLLPRVALGSHGASLTLGYIRLPLWGTKWT